MAERSNGGEWKDFLQVVLYSYVNTRYFKRTSLKTKTTLKRKVMQRNQAKRPSYKQRLNKASQPNKYQTIKLRSMQDVSLLKHSNLKNWYDEASSLPESYLWD